MRILACGNVCGIVACGSETGGEKKKIEKSWIEVFSWVIMEAPGRCWPVGQSSRRARMGMGGARASIHTDDRKTRKCKMGTIPK